MSCHVKNIKEINQGPIMYVVDLAIFTGILQKEEAGAYFYV